MPKILIKEVDQTAATGTAVTDITYVPGLMGCDASGNDFEGTFNEPILCSNIKEFESYFGVRPNKIATFSITPGDNSVKTQEIKYNNTLMMMASSDNNVDKSYIYAKELLSMGMPVVYEAIKAEQKNKLLAAMGSCTWGKDGYTSIVNDDYVKVGSDNTLSLINLEGDKDIYIEIPAKGDKYYVTIQVGKFGKIANVYESDSSDSLGVALKDVTDTFVTDKTRYIVHIEVSVPTNEILTELEYIKVMINDEGYLPFEYYYEENTSNPVAYLYGALSSRFDRLSDKSIYDVKYITSGGYPTFAEKEKTIAQKMLSVAASRGDCIALIDHVDEPNRPLVGPGSLYKAAIQNATFSDGTYGAMFTPYANYTCNTVTNPAIRADQDMPASFGYLMCLAKAIQTSPSWLAMAGVTRGIVPGINYCTCKQTLSNVVADDYQPRSNGTSMNAITPVTPYGLTVWGNRTLARAGDELKAVNFLNTRNMISDIKKQAYATARSCMFEQDSDTMWLKFKSGMSPLLDSLKSGYGISNYKLIKSNTSINGDVLGKGQVAVVIKIYPIYAVEYFEISVVIADDVTVS